MIGDAAQYQELAKLYGSFGDEELVALAARSDDLTEMAREVLQGEMTRRGLRVTTKGLPAVAEAPDLRGLSMERYAELAPEDCVWEFEGAEDALAAAEMLRAEGIECSAIVPSGQSLDRRGPRVAVWPEDVVRVEELLSRPIPDEFRVLVRTRDEFVPPACRRCGAEDPLLEAIEPANQWKCEECGHRWSDDSGVADD